MGPISLPNNQKLKHVLPVYQVYRHIVIVPTSYINNVFSLESKNNPITHIYVHTAYYNKYLQFSPRTNKKAESRRKWHRILDFVLPSFLSQHLPSV